MSDTLRAAAQQALEALLIVRNNSSVSMHQLALISPAIDALRAALAEPTAEESSAVAGDTLPPLPEPEHPFDSDDCTYACPEGFSADQMRSYAAAAVEALGDLKQSCREGWRYADELEQERKRLAAAVAEPVARIRCWTKPSQFTGEDEGHAELIDWEDGIEALPDGEHLLYAAPAAPPQREREPLTDEQIISHFKENVDTGSLLSFSDGVRFAERAHGITKEQP